MMEIFQTIWTALTTQNETLSTILMFPIYFIDAFVNMLLFTTLLNIKSERKSKFIYIVSISIIAFITRTFIPDLYGIFANMIMVILLIKFILKASWLKSLLAEFTLIAFSSVLELFMLQLYLSIFNLTKEIVMSVPLYRIVYILSIYLCIYIIYRIIKFFKFRFNLENLTQKNKILFIVNTLLGIIAIGTQFYLISFYSDKMPIGITIVSILSLFAYFFISIYSLLNTTKLETTSRNLTEAQLYNKTLSLLHDKMRGFKHDFHNIVQGIGGYISTNDMEGLKKYYSQLLKDCDQVNNLTALNPSIINNSAIYNVMADKYHKADELGVQINLAIFMDLNEIEQHMKIYEFTRILGILMDNAIEATAECKDKIIHVTFRKEENRKRILMIIENTYLNKNVDIDRIFDKDYSTKSKTTNSGLGLWEVRQVLKKNNNLNLFTTKNEEFFVQQFEIYY